MRTTFERAHVEVREDVGHVVVELGRFLLLVVSTFLRFRRGRGGVDGDDDGRGWC